MDSGGKTVDSRQISSQRYRNVIVQFAASCSGEFTIMISLELVMVLQEENTYPQSFQYNLVHQWDIWTVYKELVQYLPPSIEAGYH